MICHSREGGNPDKTTQKAGFEKIVFDFGIRNNIKFIFQRPITQEYRMKK